MGELVAALFALMAVFGMLSFFVVLIAGVVDPSRANPTVATALLTFTGSSAAGFAATWRYIVSVASKTPEPPPSSGSGGQCNLTSEEKHFRDTTGYLPMVQRDRWRP
jgi:hypothetical protein